MPANHTLAVEIDTLLQATYTPHEPGAAVIGTKGCETDQPHVALVPVSSTAFHPDGMALAQPVFTFHSDHTVAGFEWRRRSGIPQAAERIDAPPAHE